MLLLPLAYLSLVAAPGAARGWHAIHNVDVLTEGSGRTKGRAILYASPIVAGVIAIFPLLKPFFVRPPKPVRDLTLHPKDEPFLFAFVAQLCRCVSAPIPTEIRVDNEVNASAGLRRGLRSVFSRDLVLTIELPLAAGLSLRQFAGVLAHDFGHFAQGAGMGPQWVIRTVNHWFTRCVYERDAWDERLCEYLGDTMYPYDHPERDIRLQDLLIPVIPEEGGEGSAQDYLGYVERAVDRADGLYDRLLGDHVRLPTAAEESISK